MFFGTGITKCLCGFAGGLCLNLPLRHVLSSLLTFQTRAPVFFHSLLLYCLSLKTETKCGVLYFMTHPKASLESRSTSSMHPFLPFAPSVRSDSCSELCLQAHKEVEGAPLLQLQIIYGSAGPGAVTRHIILK